MINVLILYYSKQGHVKALAHKIAQGVHQVDGANSLVAKIEDIDTHRNQDNGADDDLIATNDMLNDCDALILGCPSWFGGQPASVKYFWDKTTHQWLNGTLVDKPAAVFASSNSIHGGHETVLLNAMIPLLHHGMLMVGNPYTEKSLNDTQKGGSPYGAGHVESLNTGTETSPLDKQEALLALSLGARVARIAQSLKQKS